MATAMRESRFSSGGFSSQPVRKKLKTSDLPLSSATRSNIEGLSHTFKKKGGYDTLRNEIWTELEQSAFETDFTQGLLAVAEAEIDKNPQQLLRLERGKATLLIEGAVERAGVYAQAEAAIDKLLDAHTPAITKGIRKVREEDIGVEAAAAEEARGGKTDEQFAEEIRQKQAAREKARQEDRERERILIEERRRTDKAKRREEEKRIEADQERKKEERERIKREQEDKERDLRNSHRDREHRERDERDERNRRYVDDSRHRHGRGDMSVRGEPPKPDISEVDSMSKEEIERIALNELLEEGKRVAERSSRPPMGRIDTRFAPPPRKSAPVSAIEPLDKTSLAAPRSSRFDIDSRGRRRSPSRVSRRSSRSRSRHRHDDKESRRDSRDREKGRESRDGHRRRDSKERDSHRRRSSRERHRSRSKSADRRKGSRSPEHLRAAAPVRLGPTGQPIDQWKLAEAKKRESEASAYLAAQQDARDKGLPIPGWNERPIIQRDGITSPVSLRKRDSSRDRDRTTRLRSRSRSPHRRTSRIIRSTSPENIDRYVPGRSRHKRDRSEDRDKDRERRRSRDDDRRRRSRSRSRRREKKASGRSRSPYSRREKDSRRERSRSRDRDKERRRERSRSRDRDRERERKRSRSRGSRRESTRH